jgi:4-alpha-glucanotransferase
MGRLAPPTSTPLFPPEYRASSLLLHVTSLPSPLIAEDLGVITSDVTELVPGRVEGNWCWRATKHMLSALNFQWLRDLTETYNRSHTSPPSAKHLLSSIDEVAR